MKPRVLPVFAFLLAISILVGSSTVLALLLNVYRTEKVSHLSGNLVPGLQDGDEFGYATCAVGDLDGDGLTEFAVGARTDDGEGMNRGAVWILFPGIDGRVKNSVRLGDAAGGFSGALDDHDLFGSAVAPLGDLDGDGVADLAVGSRLDDDGALDQGAVWILFLNADGTVKTSQKISATQGNFAGSLSAEDSFGRAVANLGDLDGDGVIDLAVSAYLDNAGGLDAGSVYLLFLNADGTVKSHSHISGNSGGFSGKLSGSDVFGVSLAVLGDLDGDLVPDLAVGARGDDDGGTDRGAVWILFLNSDGTVSSDVKISDTAGGFTGGLADSDLFGSGLATLPDLNGDGVVELAVGAIWDDTGGFNRGAVWVLSLDAAGAVTGHDKLCSGTGLPVLANSDYLGFGLSSMGNFDGVGEHDLMVGATKDDDGGINRGAVYEVYINGAATVGLPHEPSPGPSLVARQNPFRRDLVLAFQAAGTVPPSAKVFDVRGTPVAELVPRRENAGQWTAVWDGQDRNGVQSGAGVYFVRLVAGAEAATLRVIRLP